MMDRVWEIVGYITTGMFFVLVFAACAAAPSNTGRRHGIAYPTPTWPSAVGEGTSLGESLASIMHESSGYWYEEMDCEGQWYESRALRSFQRVLPDRDGCTLQVRQEARERAFYTVEDGFQGAGLSPLVYDVPLRSVDLGTIRVIPTTGDYGPFEGCQSVAPLHCVRFNATERLTHYRNVYRGKTYDASQGYICSNSRAQTTRIRDSFVEAAQICGNTSG